jgi:ribA/ribD-fused uncharacterized protein
MRIIAFTKVSLPFGWLGNMSPHPIHHLGKTWRTAEALFQALRFTDDKIREAIRGETSPMAAKFVAKRHKDKMVVAAGSPQDLANMRMVLGLKIEQHPDLARALLATGDALLVEDCTKRRASIWGAQCIEENWVGDNLLGKLWMELRHYLATETFPHGTRHGDIL